MKPKGSPKDDLKNKQKTITGIFYVVMLVWLVMLGVVLYDLIGGREVSSLFIATLPVVAILIILGQLKSKLRKDIESS